MEKDSDSWFRKSASSSSCPQCGGSYFPAMGHCPPKGRVVMPCRHLRVQCAKTCLGAPESRLEDDAKSSCGNMYGHVSGVKRSRKEKIRETLSVLQKIIPGGKGKGAMDVIDGTIRYLKRLKVEAKSLRLDAL